MLTEKRNLVAMFKAEAVAHRRQNQRSAVILCAFLSLFVAGCALVDRYPAGPPDGDDDLPDLEAIDHRVILIGDAGWAEMNDEVMSSLRDAATAVPASKLTVVYLGDNVYPVGLPPEDHPLRDEAEYHLNSQIDTAFVPGAETVFIAGNHEYDIGDIDGVIRQADYIAARNLAGTEMVPRGGCPGPIVADRGDHVRLIYIDSTWLIRGFPASACEDRDPGADMDPDTGVYDDLAAAVAGAGDRLVIVNLHHPLASYGPHGGFFSWQHHLFPLWNIDSLKGTVWPYLLPVPILPTVVYAVPRSQGLYSREDINNGSYSRYRDDIADALAKVPDAQIVVAGGHEHSLQIIDLEKLGLPGVYQLVSGAGSFPELSTTGKDPDAVMASPRAGFMVLDVMEEKDTLGKIKAHIEVVEVDSDKAPKHLKPVKGTFRTWLPERRIQVDRHTRASDWETIKKTVSTAR